MKNKISDVWIQTYSGIAFDLLNPKPEMVNIKDIAHALSNICRYTGHTTRFYSVAEHCLLMSREFTSKRLATWALMHDATEAYVADISRPFKSILPEYRNVEKNIEKAIIEAFDLEVTDDIREQISMADIKMLLTERIYLLGKSPYPWGLDAFRPFDNVVIDEVSPTMNVKEEYLRKAYELGIVK